LKAIVRAGVGVDNIDRQMATRLGIVVMNTPAGNTISTAEHAFALMLALSRNVAAANQSLVEGRWDRNAYMGTQLAEKTLGVVGMGRIGTEMAKRALAFEMRVIAYDPFLSAEAAAKLGVERVEAVHDMLPRIDYLTVHTPLTPETKHLIGTKEIEMLKPGVRLINAGVKPKHVRYNAIVIHLDHKRGYKDPKLRDANKELRVHNERNKVTRTDFGIAQLPEFSE